MLTLPTKIIINKAHEFYISDHKFIISDNLLAEYKLAKIIILTAEFLSLCSHYLHPLCNRHFHAGIV